jgi:3-hydroxybutyryl-CoA dehydrogenase
LLEKTAVVGAGLMGGQIALVLAMGSRQTFLTDTDQKALDKSLENIGRYASDLHRHDLLQEEPSKVVERIQTTTSLEKAAAGAEFVAEAVFEDLEVKKDVFRRLDESTERNTILSSNTSGFPISKLAAATRTPDRVVGGHFVQPAHVVPIVEVIRGDKTSDDVIKRTREIWLGLHRIPILINKDIPGFILNRIQHAMIREATFLIAEGIAGAEDIDLTVSLGLAPRLTVSGPLEQRDMNGIDLNYKIAKNLWNQLSGSEKPLEFLKHKVEKGELGLKSGRGYYDWSGMKPNDVRSARDEALLQTTQEVLGRMKTQKYMPHESVPAGTRN